MLRFLRKILGKESFPLNKIYISKNRLLNNYRYISEIDKNVKVAPVLKSNAYGHGIEIVGKILEQEVPPFFCVDSLPEAYRLYKAQIKTPVLITGYIDPRSLKAKKLPFAYAVFDLEFAKALNEYQKGCEVHIFVGTGMSREGVPISELAEFIDQIKLFKNIKVVGVMSHLASSDKPESELTKIQIKNSVKARNICKEKGLNIKWSHLGGSLALLNQRAGECNLIRSGKAIYGAGDFPKEIKPALKLTSTIVQIKKINKGAKVGYSETFIAPKDMQIGILPIGYSDGVDRRLSNKGVVMVEGKECPIIGLVSMNITTIDLSAIAEPFVGQEVEVFSDNPENKNSFAQAAKLCQTIPLELLVHLNPSIRREVI